MGMNPYELRFNLLRDAQNMLYQNWHSRFQVEERVATAEGRAMKCPSPPTADEIKALAKNLYEFVQDQS